jgi:nucleoside-triphosphatase
MKRLLLLTGSSGVGKTTVLLKIVDCLKAQGYFPGGMLSGEMRMETARVGFQIIDLNSGEKGWLAHVDQKAGPSVGKYRVNLEDLEHIGVKAMNGIRFSDFVVIDEIGPMELFSEKFRRACIEAVESRKLVIAVIHLKSSDSLIAEMKMRRDAELHYVTLVNRDSLPLLVVNAKR